MAVLARGMAIAVEVLPLFSVLLSVTGSSCIIYNLSRRRRKNSSRQREQSTTYERLLFAMSCSDIVFSTALGLQPFLAPADASHIVLSFGNATTCRIMGTVHQLGLISMFYYGMLSFYYLLTVRFQVPKDVVAKRYEPWMHLLSILWPAVTAIWGAIVDWYGVLEVFPGCWVASYPKGCSYPNCRADLVAWVTAGGWVVFFYVSLIVNNIVIYTHVRHTYRQSQIRILQQEETYNSGSSDACSLSSSIHSNNPQRRQYAEEHRIARRLRLVATQATLYVLAFFATYTTYVLLQILESMGFGIEHGTQLYALFVLQAILSPLAGFWNAIIYFRPRYMSIRSNFVPRREGEERPSIMQAVWIAVTEQSSAAVAMNSPSGYLASTMFQLRKSRRRRRRPRRIDKRPSNDNSDDDLSLVNDMELSTMVFDRHKKLQRIDDGNVAMAEEGTMVGKRREKKTDGQSNLAVINKSQDDTQIIPSQEDEDEEDYDDINIEPEANHNISMESKSEADESESTWNA